MNWEMVSDLRELTAMLLASGHGELLTRITSDGASWRGLLDEGSAEWSSFAPQARCSVLAELLDVGLPLEVLVKAFVKTVSTAHGWDSGYIHSAALDGLMCIAGEPEVPDRLKRAIRDYFETQGKKTLH